MNCSKCNALIPDDSIFCPECGQKIEAPVEAPEVEAPVTEVAETPAAPAVDIKEKAKELAEKVKPVVSTAATAVSGITAKIPEKFLKIGAAAVALILVIAIVAGLFGGSKMPNYTLYVKDGEVFYAEMPQGKNPVEVTNKFAPYASDYELGNAGDSLAIYFQLASDGKTLFYPDKIDDGYTLYCRDITKPKKDPIKIESNLQELYHINEKGNRVTYLKDDKLYQHDLKEKTKIASDVSYFQVTSDGKTILYATHEDENYNLYIKNGKKDAEKIASEISEVCYASEDLKTVVYLKDDSLYSLKVGKEATKISSNVDSVIRVYESGEIYFTKESEEEITYWDLVKDDYQDIDDWDYKYYSEWMKETTIGTKFSELYFYNGKETTALSKAVVRTSGTATDVPVIVYSALESDDLPSWSLTDYIDGDIDLFDEFRDYLNESRMFFVAAADDSTLVDLEDVYSVSLSSDGTALYARADYDEDDRTTSLYHLTLNGAKIKKTEKVDEDVDVSRMTVVPGKKTHVIYFKDVENNEGELYMDGQHIDDDVYIYSTRYNFETDQLFYFVDWDNEHDQGSLKYCDGKKATAVKDDVHSFVFTPEGECLFLYDYSDSNYRGELWILNGKKSVKLEEDVSCIIPIY